MVEHNPVGFFEDADGRIRAGVLLCRLARRTLVAGLCYSQETLTTALFPINAPNSIIPTAEALPFDEYSCSISYNNPLCELDGRRSCAAAPTSPPQAAAPQEVDRLGAEPYCWRPLLLRGIPGRSRAETFEVTPETVQVPASSTVIFQYCRSECSMQAQAKLLRFVKCRTRLC